MTILHFLAANWDSIAVVVAFVVVVLVLIAKKQYAIIEKIVFALVTEAEKKYGDGIGTAKLAAVIDWLYPKIPALIRIFITAGQIERIIEKVLADAQKRWDSNPKLTEYIKK
jgi:hypothetical protein